MYDKTITAANKIISDKDLADIFEKMNEEIKTNIKICEEETKKNEKYTNDYQEWTTKNFEYYIKCSFDFLDDTNITTNSYDELIMTFNNRIHNIKSMWLRFYISYFVQNNGDSKFVSKYIDMNIYENKIKIDVDISKEDKKMASVYETIKGIILRAPEKYDRVLRKKSLICNKIAFACGIIPSLIIFTLLAFIPFMRGLYANTFVIYPVLVIIMAMLIGDVFFLGKVTSLYNPISPDKKYAGYDVDRHERIYKDDLQKFVDTSEVIIGRNIDNIKNRKEIIDLEKKYNKFIPIEVIILLVLSIIMIFIGNTF